jgi:hypothetical protein
MVYSIRVIGGTKFVKFARRYFSSWGGFGGLHMRGFYIWIGLLHELGWTMALKCWFSCWFDGAYAYFWLNSVFVVSTGGALLDMWFTFWRCLLEYGNAEYEYNWLLVFIEVYIGVVGDSGVSLGVSLGVVMGLISRICTQFSWRWRTRFWDVRFR